MLISWGDTCVVSLHEFKDLSALKNTWSCCTWAIRNIFEINTNQYRFQCNTIWNYLQGGRVFFMTLCKIYWQFQSFSYRSVSDTELEDNTSELSGSDSDSKMGPLPPKIRCQSGRPRKERTDAEKERRKRRRGNIGRIQKCTLCRMPGHSKRTCKQPPIGS